MYKLLMYGEQLPPTLLKKVRKARGKAREHLKVYVQITKMSVGSNEYDMTIENGMVHMSNIAHLSYKDTLKFFTQWKEADDKKMVVPPGKEGEYNPTPFTAMHRATLFAKYAAPIASLIRAIMRVEKCHGRILKEKKYGESAQEDAEFHKEVYNKK